MHIIYINIIKKESVKDFLAEAIAAYQKEFKINAEVIEVDIGDGTHKLINN